MIEYEKLIKDVQSLKETKLYENSFKVIDDCTHLLYSVKKRFEYLEEAEKQRIKQFHQKYDHKIGDLIIAKEINCGSFHYTILHVTEVVDHKNIKGNVIASDKYKVGPYDILWNRIHFEKICGPIKR
jgi:hypothetical protein